MAGGALPDAHELRRRVQARVDDALVAQFQRDGAVCIRQLLTPDELALLRGGIEANLAAPSPRAKVASRPTIRAASSRTSATGRTSTPFAASSSRRRSRNWRSGSWARTRCGCTTTTCS